MSERRYHESETTVSPLLVVILLSWDEENNRCQCYCFLRRKTTQKVGVGGTWDVCCVLCVCCYAVQVHRLPWVVGAPQLLRLAAVGLFLSLVGRAGAVSSPWRLARNHFINPNALTVRAL